MKNNIVVSITKKQAHDIAGKLMVQISDISYEHEDFLANQEYIDAINLLSDIVLTINREDEKECHILF